MTIGREHRPLSIGEDAGTGEIVAEEIVICKPLIGGAVERFKDVGESSIRQAGLLRRIFTA